MVLAVTRRRLVSAHLQVLRYTILTGKKVGGPAATRHGLLWDVFIVSEGGEGQALFFLLTRM